MGTMKVQVRLDGPGQRTQAAMLPTDVSPQAAAGETDAGAGAPSSASQVEEYPAAAAAALICRRGDGCVKSDGHADLCIRADGYVILRRRQIETGAWAELLQAREQLLQARVEIIAELETSRTANRAHQAIADAQGQTIASLRSALAALISRVERTGGYATPDDQDILRAAKEALG